MFLCVCVRLGAQLSGKGVNISEAYVIASTQVWQSVWESV